MNTQNRKPKMLFFSTHDSTRAQMAEGFLRTFAGDSVEVVSTAVESPAVDPVAVEVMKESGVDITSLHARDVADSLKEHFAVVITISDAEAERHPIWPFTSNLVHWNLKDPAKMDGPPDRRKAYFRYVRDQIRLLVELNLARWNPQPA